MDYSNAQNIISEPSTAYASSGSRIDLIALSRRGIKKQAVLNLGTALDVSLKELAGLLPVTERTLQRRKVNSLLSPSVSEQIILMAEIVERGSNILGGLAPFQKWVKEESTALGGYRPLNLLDTSIGIQLVTDELGKLEYGVYS